MTWHLRNFICMSWNQLHAILTWFFYYDRKFISFYLSFKWDLQNEKVFQHMSICLHHQCWWLQCSTHQTQVCVNMQHDIIHSEAISQEVLSSPSEKFSLWVKTVWFSSAGWKLFILVKTEISEHHTGNNPYVGKRSLYDGEIGFGPGLETLIYSCLTSE